MPWWEGRLPPLLPLPWWKAYAQWTPEENLRYKQYTRNEEIKADTAHLDWHHKYKSPQWKIPSELEYAAHNNPEALAPFREWEAFEAKKNQILTNGITVGMFLEVFPPTPQGWNLIAFRIVGISPFRLPTGNQPPLHISLCYLQELQTAEDEELLKRLLQRFKTKHNYHLEIAHVSQNGTCDIKKDYWLSQDEDIVAAQQHAAWEQQVPDWFLHFTA